MSRRCRRRAGGLRVTAGRAAAVMRVLAGAAAACPGGRVGAGRASRCAGVSWAGRVHAAGRDRRLGQLGDLPAGGGGLGQADRAVGQQPADPGQGRAHRGHPGQLPRIIGQPRIGAQPAGQGTSAAQAADLAVADLPGDLDPQAVQPAHQGGQRPHHRHRVPVSHRRQVRPAGQLADRRVRGRQQPGQAGGGRLAGPAGIVVRCGGHGGLPSGSARCARLIEIECVLESLSD